MSSAPDSSVALNVAPTVDLTPATPPAAAELAPEALGEHLSAHQLAALHAITSGKNVSEAAQTAGIARRTIYNWLASDPHFRAAYNAWKKELMEFGRGRLVKMTETAIDAVRIALEKGDARLAITLLKNIGLLAPETPGQTDPELVKAEMILNRRRDRIDVAQQERAADFVTHERAGESLAKLEEQEGWDAEKQAKLKAKKPAK